MSIITDEMVERAARAAFMRGWVTPDGMTEPDLFALRRKTDPDVWRLAKDNARAALAAVAPMIAAAERKRCLAVARRWTRDGQSATAHGIILGIEELDAIRARSTEDTTP